MEIDGNKMIITLDSGESKTMLIYFFYRNEERGKDVYFLYEENNPDELIAMASSDGESLQELSEEEFEEAQEVLDTYESDPKILEARE